MYLKVLSLIATENTWKETQNELNRLLDFVNLWLLLNKLSLNVKKTVYIPFGNYCDSVPLDLSIRICDKAINRVNSYKYLGVTIDYNVKWNEHTDTIVKKIIYLPYVFYKLAKIMDIKTLSMVYYALFHSVINYGIIAWGGSYKNSLRVG